MFKHFLQSEAWQKYEETEGHKTFADSSDDYSYLAVKHKTKLGSYLMLPYGPSLKSDDKDPKAAINSLKHALDSLKTLAKSENCFFIRLEPTVPFSESALKSLGCRKSADVEPAHTWCLKLDDKSEEEILFGFSHGTRSSYNQFARKGLSIEISKNQEDIKELVKLQTALAKKKGITAYSETHLRHELEQPFATLYLVHYKNPETKKDTIVAASLFFDDEKNKTRFYMQSASSIEFKNLPATAGMLATSVFDAKKKDLKYFDFWGIAPDDAPKTHPWYGFTRFKKSFGGFAVTYAGTYDLSLNKTKYSLYKKLRAVNRKLRKI